MRLDSILDCRYALHFLSFVVAAGILLPSFAQAQDGVAGATPVFSGSKKQPPEDPNLARPNPDIRVQSNLVTDPVTVLDASGEFVYDLNESDFQILDNGVPQRIANFETETGRITAVILIQVNEAVAPLLDQVRALGPVFSDLMLGAEGQAAVIFFDDRVRVVQDFSNDRERLSATLRGVTARGDKSRLNDALIRAIALLEKRPKQERRVVIAFSDGFDRGSETDHEEVVRRATGAEVSIYGLGFNPAQALLMKKPEAPEQSPLDTNVTRPLPPGVQPTPTNSENVYGTPVAGMPIMFATGEIIRSALASSLLEYYAGYTGGVFYSHWSKKRLEEQLAKIASEINSQYELAYVPDTLAQPGFHRLEVQVRRPGARVRTRAGYFPPGKKQ
jgi:VWFA-related protein